MDVESQASALYAKLEECTRECWLDMTCDGQDPGCGEDDVFWDLGRSWLQYGDGETEMTPALRKEFSRITGISL